MRKLISYTIMVLSIGFFSCSSSKTINNLNLQTKPPFKVVEATYSEWLGAQPEAHGVSVQIHLDKANIQLDSIYFRNSSTKLKLDKNTPNIVYVARIVLPKNNKELQLDIDPKNEFGNQVPDISQKIPFQLAQDEAVVSYLYKNKTYYYKISGLTKVENKGLKKH